MLQGSATGSAVGQLDYFDALQDRPSVTWDELIAGVLLAAGRRADGTPDQRLQRAAATGLLGQGLMPDPSRPVSTGDLALVLLRAQGSRLRENMPAEEAVMLAARRSLLPEGVGPNDALTGELAVQALVAVGRPNNSRPTRTSSTNLKSTAVPTAAGNEP